MAILAGGASRRMGRNKALLELGGMTVIERIVAASQPLSNELFVVADDREAYAFLDLPIVGDIRKGGGPLAGLHTALSHASLPVIGVLACDLPFLTTNFLCYLKSRLGSFEAVFPRAADRLQPLCAFYTVTCLEAVEAALLRDDLRMDAFHDDVNLKILEPIEWKEYDPEGTLFANINSTSDYDRARTWLAQKR